MTKKERQEPVHWVMRVILCITINMFSISVFSVVQETDKEPKAVRETVVVERAWSRETFPGHSSGVVYLDIKNSSADVVRLMGMSSDIASSAQLHESRLMEGIMKMQSLSFLSLSPGETISLKPGGFHVMLMGLKHPLKVGDSHQLILNFSTGGTLVVEVMILPISQLSFPD